MSYSKSKLKTIWNKSKKVKGKDPNKYRVDPCGRIMYQGSYGKKTPMGWEVDHKTSKKDGGSNHITNLQAANWITNRIKGSKSKNYCKTT